MPVHDWTRVDAGTFHAFHTVWISEIMKALNAGLLPKGYYALAEQVATRMQTDVLTLRAPLPAAPTQMAPLNGGVAGDAARCARDAWCGLELLRHQPVGVDGGSVVDARLVREGREDAGDVHLACGVQSDRDRYAVVPQCDTLRQGVTTRAVWDCLQ